MLDLLARCATCDHERRDHIPDVPAAFARGECDYLGDSGACNCRKFTLIELACGDAVDGFGSCIVGDCECNGEAVYR